MKRSCRTSLLLQRTKTIVSSSRLPIRWLRPSVIVWAYPYCKPEGAPLSVLFRSVFETASAQFSDRFRSAM